MTKDIIIVSNNITKHEYDFHAIYNCDLCR